MYRGNKKIKEKFVCIVQSTVSLLTKRVCLLIKAEPCVQRMVVGEGFLPYPSAIEGDSDIMRRHKDSHMVDVDVCWACRLGVSYHEQS